MKNLHAKAVFETACKALDNQNIRYHKEEETNQLFCHVALDEDMLLDIHLQVDADRQLAIQIVHLPIQVSEDKQVDMAVATTMVNNSLADGCFDFDFSSGDLYFRMTNSFMGSSMGEEVFFYMMACACQTVAAYFDKLLLLASGMITIEQFFEAK